MLKALVLSLMLFFSGNVWAQSDGSPGELGQLKAEISELKAQLKILQDRKLQCSDGKSVQGLLNKWSPWSQCPEGLTATGLARVDIQGNHEVATNHVNDFQCGDKGCRAWCIGNPCEVIARCCK